MSAADVRTVLGQLRTGVTSVTAWLADQGDAVDPVEIGGLLAAFGRLDAAVTAGRWRAIAAAEAVDAPGRDGGASLPAWVAEHLRVSQAVARQEVRLAGEVAAEMPEVLDALVTGEVSRDHAAALVGVRAQQIRDQRAAEAARAAHEERERRARELASARAQQAVASAADRRRHAQEAAERERRIAEDLEAQRVLRERQAAEAREAAQAALLAEARRGASADALRQQARRERAEVDVDALRRAEAAQWTRRELSTWVDQDTGMGMVKAALPVEEHERLLAALDALHTFDPPATPPEERRAAGQRRADALIALVRRSLGRGDLPTVHGTKPHMTVTVTVDTLLGIEEVAGRTSRGTWLSPEALRRIACDAGLTRAVLDAEGRVLDIGRETRSWTVAQYRAAEVAFGGCAFPVGEDEMCGRPPQDCDLHHVRFWRDGGRTDTANGVLLCPHHHDAVHGGWTLSYDHARLAVTISRQRIDGTLQRRTARGGVMGRGASVAGSAPDEYGRRHPPDAPIAPIAPSIDGGVAVGVGPAVDGRSQSDRTGSDRVAEVWSDRLPLSSVPAHRAGASGCRQ